MLVYCNEVRNPYVNAIVTMTQTGVPRLIVANNMIITPSMMYC